MSQETCINCDIEVIGEGFKTSEGLFCCERCYKMAVELKNAVREREDAYLSTINALIAALDVREHETGGHSQRVSKYTHFLASKLGLPGEECLAICRGALLHDIGKIGVPDAILLKEGKLTKEEWRLMRQHPEMGRQILSGIDFLQPSAAVVYYHHERYDGDGYPTGLKGEAIPIGSRLFAVADTVDAITSNRPYHKKRHLKDASKIIKAGERRQFDPEIVAIFLTHLLEFRELFALE